MSDETPETADHIGVVSHELRTPLISVNGFAELLIDKPEFAADPARVVQYARIIEFAGKRSLDLANAMLDLLKEKPEGVTLADLSERLTTVPQRSMSLELTAALNPARKP